jgi:hypothetical protein
MIFSEGRFEAVLEVRRFLQENVGVFCCAGKMPRAVKS